MSALDKIKFMLFASTIAEPLGKLTEAARTLARGEEFRPETLKAMAAREDEVGALAQAFAEMAEAVQTREAALREEIAALKHNHLVTQDTEPRFFDDTPQDPEDSDIHLDEMIRDSKSHAVRPTKKEVKHVGESADAVLGDLQEQVRRSRSAIQASQMALQAEARAAGEEAEEKEIDYLADLLGTLQNKVQEKLEETDYLADLLDDMRSRVRHKHFSPPGSPQAERDRDYLGELLVDFKQKAEKYRKRASKRRAEDDQDAPPDDEPDYLDDLLSDLQSTVRRKRQRRDD